jgi:hypothetical protein
MAEKHPAITSAVGQIFIRHYNRPPAEAFKEASRLIEVLGAYDFQIIKGDWVVPEVVTVEVETHRETRQEPKDPWMALASKVTQETMDREPWKAREIQ